MKYSKKILKSERQEMWPIYLDFRRRYPNSPDYKSFEIYVSSLVKLREMLGYDPFKDKQ